MDMADIKTIQSPMEKKAGLKLFLLKVSAVVLPLFLALLFPLFVLTKGGEFFLLETVERIQRNPEHLILYGPAYSDYQMKLKYLGVRNRKPRLIALGTSRVMQFRSQFFNQDVTFYNAGGGVARGEDLKAFLDRLPLDAQPEVILLGLDQNFFNHQWVRNSEKRSIDTMFLEDDIEPLQILRTRWKRVYKDYFEGKFTLGDIIRADRSLIGLSAIMKRSGFRNDGSYMHGLMIKEPHNPEYNDDYEFIDTMRRIDNGNKRFEYGTEIRQESVAELKEFLAECKRRRIHVSAFLPPYAHAVHEKMRSMEGRYEYIWKLHSEISPVFEKYGYKIQDYSDMSVLGAGDEEALDGFHGSEKAYLRLWLKMQGQDTILRQFSDDQKKLESVLNESQNPLLLFPGIR